MKQVPQMEESVLIFSYACIKCNFITKMYVKLLVGLDLSFNRRGVISLHCVLNPGLFNPYNKHKTSEVRIVNNNVFKITVLFKYTVKY